MSCSSAPRPCRSTSAPAGSPAAGRTTAVIGSTICESSRVADSKRSEVRWQDLRRLQRHDKPADGIIDQ